MDKDICYVGGGNTRNLLVLWKEWGLDQHLYEAWCNGAIMAGLSAGSICWFKQGLTDSKTGKLLPLECLGFIEGSNCPHFDTEKGRRPSYHDAILDICDDVRNGVQLHQAIRARKIFPTLLHQMTAIGEESGTLDDMLGKVALHFEEAVNNAVDNLTNLLEPLVMTLLGIVIGGLLIAMYLPIFQLGNML